MGGSDGSRELQIFLNRELLVESIVLRNVGDVLQQRVEVVVKRSVVEQHFSGDWREES